MSINYTFIEIACFSGHGRNHQFAENKEKLGQLSIVIKHLHVVKIVQKLLLSASVSEVKLGTLGSLATILFIVAGKVCEMRTNIVRGITYHA